MKQKILPIYPVQSKDDFWGFGEALKIIGKKACNAPTGLLTVMSMIPEENFEVLHLLDANVELITNEKLLRAKGGYVFSSSMAVNEKSQNEIFEQIKKLNNSLTDSEKIKIVAGGPLPTATPKKAKGADYIVAGEAEMTLPVFLEDLLAKTPQPFYDENSVKKRININLTKSGKPDLIKTPIPKWDIVPDLNVYQTIGLQYSRGCPFDCEFCNITSLFGREPRTKSPKQMIKEFDELYNKKFRGEVFVVDDNFIGNKKNALEFLPELIKWQKERNYPYSLITEASVNLAWESNKQLLEEMVDAGFKSVFLGIESVDPKVLEKMNKKQNLKMNPYDVIKTIQNAGISVAAGFIVGNDGEDQNACNSIYNFAQQTGIPAAMVGPLTVMPGTKLEKRLIEEGRLRNTSQTGSNTIVTGEMDFDPQFEGGYSEKRFFKDYDKLLHNLYTNSKNYFDRCKTLRDSLESKISAGSRPLKESVATFARYMNHFLKNPDRYEMKYILETILKKPAYFVNAITDAVKYTHFSRLAMISIEANK